VLRFCSLAVLPLNNSTAARQNSSTAKLVVTAAQQDSSTAVLGSLTFSHD